MYVCLKMCFQCVAVCCSALQCVAACCSALQCTDSPNEKIELIDPLIVFKDVMYVYRCISKTTAHGEDHTQNIWISRSYGFPARSFECQGLRLHT